MSQPYVPKTVPFEHQARLLAETWDREAFAIFWEMGTGKSKLIIDTAAMLWRAHKINGVLIVAPGSVHTNWIREELPTHLPDNVRRVSTTHIYRAGKAHTIYHTAEVNACVQAFGLAWLAISYDAFMTEKGKIAVKRFLKNRRVLQVLDESMFIKTPGAKRTKSIVASGRHAPYRRILSGTPAPNSPFDLYPQFRFLDENFWKRGHEGIQPIGSAHAFRHTFGHFRNVVSPTGKPDSPGTQEAPWSLYKANANLAPGDALLVLSRADLQR